MTAGRKIFFDLVKNTVFGTAISPDVLKSITAENLAAAYKLAIDHSLSHLILSALKNNGLTEISPDITAKAKKAVYFASVTTDMQTEELGKITEIFDNNGIRYIVLKGAVMRNIYPESWMRIGCDIDILVERQNVQNACNLLIDKLGYSADNKTEHDIPLRSKNSVSIELHYDLLEDYQAISASSVLEKVWEYSNNSNGNKTAYQMSPEMFIFYHISHMAKHCEVGGCGARAFLDLYLLKNLQYNSAKLETLLTAGGLSEFACQVNKLAEIWFGNGSEIPELNDVADYIIEGATYGSIDTIAAVRGVNHGKFGGIITLAFPPYSKMAQSFPVLYKQKWLLPIYWIYRPIRALFKGKGKMYAGKLKASGNLSNEKIKTTDNVLSKLGLK